jgi:ELWxxDGT repeat protein
MRTRLRLPPAGTALACAFAAALLPTAAPAQDAFTRLTDIRPGTQSGVPGLSATIWNGDLYFIGYVGNFDSRIFRWDGEASPVEVAGAGAMPDEPVVFDGELYFRGGPFSDRELWRWDGVNPPVEALDLFASGSGGFPEELTVFGSELCFGANTASGHEPLCWTGSGAPTNFDIRPGTSGSNADTFAVVDGKLYFTAYDDATGSEGYEYTGTGQPALVGDLRPGTGSGNPRNWSALGDDLYFVASDEGGQGRVFHRLAGELPEQDDFALDVEGEAGAAGGAYWVPGHDDDDTTPYVHRYDGLAATRLRPSVTFADSFLLHRGAVYFVAGFSSPSRDLWRWCGSESVELVSTIFASSDDALTGGRLLEFDGRLVFSATQGLTTGSELWVLDAMTPLFCHGFDGEGIAAWSDSVP